jgi:hypothetical protein
MNGSPPNPCLGEVLGDPDERDLEPFLKRTIFVYLDMVGSTQLKKELRREEATWSDIFYVFHRVLTVIERTLGTVLPKESRVGDALLFTGKYEHGASDEQLRQPLCNALERICSLPTVVRDGVKNTILRNHVPEFRIGVHVGHMHAELHDPLPSCIRPTEIISYDLDLVTKSANLSDWNSAEARAFPALSRSAIRVIQPLIEQLKSKDVVFVTVVDEEEYQRTATRLYENDPNEDVYSVVDFSIFDAPFLQAVERGAKTGKLHMTGWLNARLEAPFGALIRKAIAPNLDLRLPRFPDALLTRSHIVAPQTALVGQPFSFGQGGRHFLVGKHLADNEAREIHSQLATKWASENLTFSQEETQQTLRAMALKAAKASSLNPAALNRKWVCALTSLGERRCAQLIEMIEDAGYHTWRQDVARCVNNK